MYTYTHRNSHRCIENVKLRAEEWGRILELVGESPDVRVNPVKGGEGGRTHPYVEEPVRVGVGNSRVSPISVSKVLLHFSFALSPFFSPSSSLSALFSFLPFPQSILGLFFLCTLLVNTFSSLGSKYIWTPKVS